MNERMLFVATVLGSLGCGLIGGAFFAFSTFVMKALARLAPVQGIAAMQSINVVVINAWFMGALFGTAALCAGLAIRSLLHPSEAGAGYVLAGSALYLLGTIGVTIAFNVPRNDALAAIDPSGAGAADVWATYVRQWTLANHVRTAAALAASAMLIVGLVRRSQL